MLDWKESFCCFDFKLLISHLYTTLNCTFSLGENAILISFSNFSFSKFLDYVENTMDKKTNSSNFPIFPELWNFIQTKLVSRSFRSIKFYLNRNKTRAFESNSLETFFPT